MFNIVSLPPTPQVPLKPNIYYELTDGVELTFANLTCHYLIPQPEGDEEQTQDYGAEEATKDEAEGEARLYSCGDFGELRFVYLQRRV